MLIIDNLARIAVSLACWQGQNLPIVNTGLISGGQVSGGSGQLTVMIQSARLYQVAVKLQ